MADSSRGRPPALSPTEVRRIQDEEAYPYIITQEIGKGSFATVYKGFHDKTRKAVAVKTVSRSILTHKLLENLESEIAILKALTHKHITELKDIVKARNNIYLVMEYCSGGDLSKYIRHRGRVEGLEYAPYAGAALQYWPHPKTGGLDPVVVRSFLGQLSSALKFLRDRNLIHRDIKPQNLLLEPSTPADAPIQPGIPLLKIADFGFARSLPNATLAETLCGSPLYMAPEILRYEKYDAKADLWSVGAVLYEMSVGKPPFRAQNHMELLKKIEHARGRVNFPDEVAAKEALKAQAQGLPASPRSASGLSKAVGEKEVTVVPQDIKALIRMLLKRKPVERASFEQFFDSEAVHTQMELLRGSLSAPGDSPNGKRSSSASRGSSSEPPSAREGNDPPAKRRERAAKEMDRADKDALPLEGTPYDPKLYVPQPALKFRRSQLVHQDGSSSAAGPSVPHRGSPPQPVTVNPDLNSRPEVKWQRDDREEALADALSNSKPEREYVIVDAEAAVAAPNGMSMILGRTSHLSVWSLRGLLSELDMAWKRPNGISRTTSTGVRGAAAAAALTKQVGRLVIGATIGNGTSHSPPKIVVPPATAPIPIESRQPPSALATQSTPPFATQVRRASEPPASDPIAIPEKKDDGVERDAAAPVPMTFPPPPNPRPIPITPSPSSAYAYGHLVDGYSRSQPSALVRAINLASKKLFGSPTHQVSSSPGSAGASGVGLQPQTYGGGVSSRLVLGTNGVENAEGKREQKLKEAEDRVLGNVENIAQKAQVLRDFADSRFAKVEAVSSGHVLSPSHFTRKKGEPPRTAEARRKQEQEMETNLVQAIALYLATMGFCQKGLDDLNKYCEEHLDGVRAPESGEASTGIDDAIVWFRETFDACADRSTALKGWLPEGHQGTNLFIDRVIYDHALALMRHAASKELLEENFPLVQKEYERALWMLYAIADDVIQEENPFRDQDVATITGFIETTKTRLMRLRRRMESLGNGGLTLQQQQQREYSQPPTPMTAQYRDTPPPSASPRIDLVKGTIAVSATPSAT
ncbi:Serine/threonine-protein kinase [Tulasnella sp. 403]|nr:Serine/threonine-protein kinase [Tulasnella sp. 403]